MRGRAGTSIAAVLALVGASLAALVLVAGPAGATDVSDEASFRTAFTNAAETTVTLTADITLTNCGTGAVTRNSTTPVTVEGNGFTVTQTCAAIGLQQTGTGAVTLSDLGVAGGTVGAEAAGDLVLSHVNVSGQSNASGAVGVYSHTLVDATDSTISNVTSSGAAYGAFVDQVAGSIKLTNTTITGIQGTTFVLGAQSDGSLTSTGSSVHQVTGGGSGEAAGLAANTDLVMNGGSISGVSAGADTYGVFAENTATVTDASITSVSSTGSISVGVYGNSGATVTRSTVSAITGLDGGIGVYGGAVNVQNSTITGVAGPAVYAEATQISYSDIVGNGSANFNPTSVEQAHPAVHIEATTAPAQLYVGTADIFGTVVTSSVGGFTDCLTAATVSSKGYNFADDSSCTLTATGDTQTAGADPMLGTLADNGGPTPTLLPQTGSPLLDKIPPAACQTAPATGVTTDQRSLARPAFTNCDIGAVELQPAPVIQPTFTG